MINDRSPGTVIVLSLELLLVNWKINRTQQNFISVILVLFSKREIRNDF